MRAAVIGIGSNSLRMLIADIHNAQLSRILRDREGLRVFAALDENGDIRPEMMEKACQSVGAMKRKALERGAEAIHLFATSAVRDARNQAVFASRLHEATGLSLRVCSGEEEARLSFIGATGSERSGVIDIGGGSTEVVIGRGERLDFSESLQIGAVRLFRQFPVASVADAYRVRDAAAAVLEPWRARIRGACPAKEWFGVGGTFTTTAALVQDIPWTERDRIHGFRAGREDVRRVLELLAPLSVEERLLLPGLQPQRADIVVHGLAILLCCMEQLSLDSITVSEYGNLEGYLKTAYLQ